MRHLTLLIPFALPPAELAGDLTRQLRAPALATLLARAAMRDESFDPFDRSLPHEVWLARQFGLESRLTEGGSPPAAAAAMRACGLPSEAGTWFLLQPAHLHIARDHLVLTDLRQLMLSEPESRQLFEAAQPLFEEAGKPLRYGDAATWFLRADGWETLQTSTPLAATGHNIDIWMPKGAGERDWRKLLNEVQMLWHLHALNAGREERRLLPVNSLWLWGGTPAASAAPAASFDAAFNLPAWADALARQASRPSASGDALQALGAPAAQVLAALDDLAAPALASDWGDWLARFEALEKEWITPALAGLKAGKMESVSLILSHGSQLRICAAGRGALRKFWIKPSLARLAP